MEAENVVKTEVTVKKEKDRGGDSLGRKGKALMAVLIGIVLMVYTALLFMVKLVTNVQSEYYTLCNAASTSVDSDGRREKVVELYANMCEKSSSTMFQLIKAQYDGADITPDILETLNASKADDNSYYFMNESGRVSSAPGAAAIPLDTAQLEQLKAEGKLETDDTIYFCEDCDNGYIISGGPLYTSDAMESLHQILYYDLLYYDPDTGEITDVVADDTTAAKLMAVGSVDKLRWNDLTDNAFFNRDGLPAYMFYIEGGNTEYLAAHRPEPYADGSEEYFFISLNSVIADTFEEMFLPLVYLIAFAVFSLTVAVKIRRDWEKGRIRGKEFKLFNKFQVDGTVCANILTIQFFVFVLTIIMTLSFRTLWRYTSLYDQAESHLDSLQTTCEENAEVSDAIEIYFEDEIIKEARICADFLSRVEVGKIDMDIEDYITQMQDLTGAEAISIFDGNGKIIYSTDDYEGYKLSSMEDDCEYKLWSLINGEKSEIAFKEDDVSGSLYCGAVRRTDSIGLVRVEMSNVGIRQVQNELETENAMKLASFGDSDKLYAYQSDPGTLYRIKAGSTEVETFSNTLPQLAALEECTSIYSIRGQRYFVCGTGTDDLILYNADSIDEIMSYLYPTALSMSGTCLIITLIILMGTAVYSGEAPAAETGYENYTFAVLADIRRKKLFHGVITVLAVTAGLLLIDLVTQQTPIPYFLFWCNWERGVNIFSIASIVFILVMVIVGLKLIKLFFRLLANGLPSYSATVLQLLNSVLNAVVVIWFIVNSFEKVGVDMQTIIAGLGITGLAVGIGARDTISDLVAGIFLILDGHVRVGDMINVGGFYGEVMHLGIRNTKVRCGNQEISIQNSDMKNVINCSKDTAWASIEFAVAAAVETDTLRGIINDNRARFRTACGDKLLGDVALNNITGFESYGDVRYELSAPVNEKDREQAVGEMNEVFRTIMAENNISFHG